MSLGTLETHPNQPFEMVYLGLFWFHFLYRADQNRVEGVIEQRARAGWQEPPWQEHISAMPGRGEFSQTEWMMVEPDGEFLLAG